MEFPKRLWLWMSLGIFAAVSVCRSEEVEEKAFHIQKLAVEKMVYPGEGDEAVDVKYGGLTYSVKILHPVVFEGPHFSMPVFWVTEEKDKVQELVGWNAQVGGVTLIHPLVWHSLYSGYFFAENKMPEGSLSGFFLQDGRDNADTGAEGLLFLFDGVKAVVWNWSYEYGYDDAGKRTPSILSVTGQGHAKEKAPEALMKRLDPIFKHAEKEAGRWPGP